MSRFKLLLKNWFILDWEVFKNYIVYNIFFMTCNMATIFIGGPEPDQLIVHVVEVL